MLHRFQPLNDPRWREFLQRHPSSSVFHTAEWLDALRRTYGYEPLAFTTSRPGADLKNAVVFCHVKSWLSGRRLVSLPFSDHCDPLVDGSLDFAPLLGALKSELDQRKARYLEIRPAQPLVSASISAELDISDTFCRHQIDLRPSLDQLFLNCHKDSTQRKIRRAEREGLSIEDGAAADNFDHFYRLLTLTRRRHLLPPQPKKWFYNLIAAFGAALKIRIAFKNRQPIAAILTLRHRNVLTYKYGCSDPRFHNLGGMQLLLWTSIQQAKQEGLSMFDLGRSDWDEPGLITFKERLGAQRSNLSYFRWSSDAPPRTVRARSIQDWKRRTAGPLLQYLPDPVLRAAGTLFYKHAG